MNSSSKRTMRPFGIFMALAMLPAMLYAQDRNRDKYDTIAAKYKTENAVYTNYAGQLVITIEDGQLVANNHTTVEKLYLTERSLNNLNRDYFEYGDFNRLTDYSGVAYIPTKGKGYKTVECGTFGSGRPRDYTFYDDTRVAVAYYSGLSKYSITETKYSTENTDVHMLSGFIFRDYAQDLPIYKASYEVVAPANVNISFALSGGNTDFIKQSKVEKNGKVYYRFTADNIPAGKNFSDIPSWRYYMPHVIPYITSFRLDGAKKDSVIAKGPNELYRYLYNYVRHINAKTDTFITKTAAELTQDDKTPKEKAAHIFKWVQDNIHYVAIENGLEGFIPRPADTVMKRKYGDCKDMASITQALCRKAGLKAYLAWIGTDYMPYRIEDIPLNVNFNHMICAVKVGEEWVFLDGTNNVQPYGGNRKDIQGKEVLIAIDEKNYEIVTIPVEPADKNVCNDSTYIKIDGDKVAGSLTRTYNGYGAWDVGMYLMYNKKADEKEKFIRTLTSRGSNKYTQEKYEVKANKAGGKDVTVNAEFVVDDYVHQAGRQCFVNMNLLRHAEDKRIDTKDRTVPCYNDYKSKRREVVVLEIPKGYKVSHLPAAVKGSLDNLWSYSIKYTTNKKTITLTKEYEFNALSIGTDKFAANNKLVDDLKKIYNESVVLTTN